MDYAYQWQRCNASGGECANIEGTMKQSYTLGEEDVSKTLRVVVTASNSEGSASATSAVTPIIASGSSSSGIRYLYDEAGRLKIIDDPNQGAAVYHWDADGNLLSIQRYSNTTLAVLTVTPPHAPPGEQVDITGTGFSPEASHDEVSFNGVKATISKADTTDLIVTVPEGATTGPITVKVGEKTTEGSDFTPHVAKHPSAPTPKPDLTEALSSAATSDPGTSTSGTGGPQSSATSERSTAAKQAVKSNGAKTKCAPQTRGHAIKCAHDQRAHASKRKARTACHHAERSRQRYRRARCVDNSHRKTSHSAESSKAADPKTTHVSAPGAAPVENANSSSGAVPATVSNYHSPYSATWTPTIQNHQDGNWVTGRTPSS